MTLYELRKYEKRYSSESGAAYRASIVKVAHEAGTRAIDHITKYTGKESALEWLVLNKMIKMLQNHQKAMKKYI